MEPGNDLDGPAPPLTRPTSPRPFGAPACCLTDILKTRHPDAERRLDWRRNDGGPRARHGGREEIEFYTQIAPFMADRIVPRCFDTHWDSTSRGWHLLLEDLTNSHAVSTDWPSPPFQSVCETILTARARFHAAWWDDPRLGVSAGRWVAADEISLTVEQNFAAFAKRLGDAVASDHRDLLRRFLDATPRLFNRYHSHRNVTIVQGDAHIWNCFLPRDGGDDVRLFDWEAWRPHVAAIDLANMMAPHFETDQRRRMEQPLLDHYHAALAEHGVRGYDRRALQDGYRWAVLLQILTPAQLAVRQAPAELWWDYLDRIMAAVDDLGCREFLG